jgi:DNA-binding transcriptional LysR family regulator
LKRRPLQELGHVAAVSRMVELGLGVGVLPVDAHWPAPAGSLVSRPLVPEVTVTTFLVHRRNRSLRPNAAAAWTQFAAPESIDAHGGATSSPSQAITGPAFAPRGALLHEP